LKILIKVIDKKASFLYSLFELYLLWFAGSAIQAVCNFRAIAINREGKNHSGARSSFFKKHKKEVRKMKKKETKKDKSKDVKIDAPTMILLQQDGGYFGPLPAKV